MDRDTKAPLAPVHSLARVGDPADSATGRLYWPADPRPDDVGIKDIALALSKVCRFGGHVAPHVELYSVAQHSVLVSLHCDPQHALVGLLHDAHEAYLGDPIRPMHPLLGTDYWIATREWQIAIALHVGLPQNALRAQPLSVKRADVRALVTERRDVCAYRSDWEKYRGIEPFADVITPLRAFDAYDAFVARYAELVSLQTVAP
jgi:5'-deoxynucleotidase YfbR-like HD superfamily hydrolase